MHSPPALGALGMTWTAMRGMQFVSLITIIGLTSNFISEMVMADYAAPSALIGTLVVVSLIPLASCSLSRVSTLYRDLHGGIFNTEPLQLTPSSSPVSQLSTLPSATSSTGTPCSLSSLPPVLTR